MIYQSGHHSLFLSMSVASAAERSILLHHLCGLVPVPVVDGSGFT